MADLLLEGLIKEVGKVDYVGENKTPKQSFILLVSGYTDDFGDKKGEDEEWQITILGDKVASTGMANNAIGKMAKVKVFLKSRRVQAKIPLDPDMFIINANMGAVKIL